MITKYILVPVTLALLNFVEFLFVPPEMRRKIARAHRISRAHRVLDEFERKHGDKK